MAGRWSGGGGGGEVVGSIYSVLALVLILVACVELGDAATAVDVYRLIQYDLSGAPYGSRLAGLNHHAGAAPFAPGADLSRTVVILPVRELNLTFLQEYITSKQPLGGLLLLLPQDIRHKSAGGNKSRNVGLLRSILSELEQLLIHVNLPYPVYFAYEDDKINAVLADYPVYFAYEDDKINAVLADVRRGDASGQPATATTGGYKLVVSTPEPRKASSPTITNIQGWLPGLVGDGTTQLPTIAVVASYDTFGAAPALSVGSDSNGSGVVALLEIARLFSRLYSSPKTRGRYNLLFGLTSGGPYNYNGTMKWLRSFDQRLRESIEYAICLNSVGSWNNELWLHVSKPPENVYIKQVYESFSEVAKELGVSVGIKHKKINISNPRVAWEHEQFSRVRVTAVTLSELSVAPELLQSTGGLYDTRHIVDETAIHRSIKLVAESLVRHIYGYEGKNIQIFADNSSLAVNPSYVKSWLDLLSRTPRVAPFLSKNDPIISALKKELSDHTDEVHLQHESIDGMFNFYDSTQATLNIYQVASVTFDLLLLLALGSYLILLFSFLVITTRVVLRMISRDDG
ncbi:hypothetical protein C4D60_Mb09t02470 [Musa balbisiana]|uniref:Nicalin n=1 Tax=Musa balbisiana TaxID=52838 RepID=A0A4S8IFW7_MUSBA|nr:hypothetical protein C4D60_Mb09t02470 [Musa balbisiana]